MSHRLPPAAQKEFERAVRLFREGRLATADSICTELAARHPENAEVMNFGGVLANRLGRYDVAVQRLTRCVQAEPGRARAFAALGFAHERLNQLEDARRAFAAAVAAEPSFPEAHNGLGVALLRAGRPAEAAASLQRAISLDPRSVEARLNLGNALRQLGRAAAAAHFYREAAALASGRDDVLRVAALGMLDAEDAEGAIPLLRSFLERSPGDSIARSQLALALDATGSADEALAQMQRALVPAAPAVVHNAHGTLRLHRGEWQEARAALGEALRLDPSLADARVNLALALRELGDPEASLRCMREAEPGLDAHGLARLAAMHGEVAQSARAIELAERSLAMSPSLAGAHTTLSVELLRTGRLERGWREHVYRPTRGTGFLEEVAAGRYPPRLPASLAGRDVLVMAEQGLGDVLFFLRYAAPIVAAGARLHVGNCDARLRPMIERALPIASWSEGEGLAQDAIRIWAGDLPAFVRPLTGRDVEPPLAVAPLEERRQAIRARLGDRRPVAGIAWRAGTAPRSGPVGQKLLSKEIAPRELGRALAGLGLRWVVVQRRPRKEEIDELQAGLGEGAIDLSSVNEDLEEVLALMGELDEYVGVSSTNVHLRAGLGLGGRILVPYPADWRWQASGQSPFFEKFATYREGPAGWGDALARVRADLEGSVP